jgi:benzylsuccinate CoA-transferase BbsF subunit
VGPWGAYTDFITPRYGVAAISSALIHCARTGEGQYIDVSQIEAGMRFLEPLALDYTSNGRIAGLAGHDSLYACPHGVYACEGVERYVAIAVETAEQWQALRQLAPLGEFSDPSLDALAARLAQRDAIEERLRSWCREQTAETLAERLRAGGVPAYLVNWSTDLHTDQQLAHREHFVTLDHAEMGPQPFDGPVTRFSRTPSRLSSASPTVGQHTFEVLKDVLGLSDDEIADLAAAEALS